MTAMKKGLLVGLIHLLLVSSLGAKLLIDRAMRPRVWVQSFAYDPNLPIRGRYVALRGVVETDPPASQDDLVYPQNHFRLEVRNGKLFAVRDKDGTVSLVRVVPRTGEPLTLISQPSLFFIPDTARDPSFRNPGEQLWFEATIPKKGPPRPIRLAFSKPDGKFTPMDVK